MTTTGPPQFSIDVKASLVTVQAFASGIVAVIAHSPKFAMRDITGDIKFVGDSPEDASFRASVRLDSLEIMDEVNSSDRREIERVMFDEVLETKAFQMAEFRSNRISATKTGENMYRVNVAGDLSLYGMTRRLAFDSQAVVGEDTLRAQGSFAVLQSDYGLRIASVASGTLKLRDELRVGFFLIARRKDLESGGLCHASGRSQEPFYIALRLR